MGELRGAIRAGGLLGAWAGGVLWAWLAVAFYWGRWGLDAHAYWSTGHRPDLYGPAPGTFDAFNYSPAFAQAVHPLTGLPFPVFAGLFIGAEAVAFAWLLAPLGWRWAVPLWLFCAPEIILGNIVGTLAVACVLAVTRPGGWAYPVLTKVTTGGVGVLWHVGRGEWRKVVVAAVWTCSLVAVSAAVWPQAWADWAAFLAESPATDPAMPVRLLAGVAVALLGGVRGWRWTIPLAMVLASPVISVTTLPLLAATVRLSSTRQHAEESVAVTSAADTDAHPQHPQHHHADTTGTAARWSE